MSAGQIKAYRAVSTQMFECSRLLAARSPARPGRSGRTVCRTDRRRALGSLSGFECAPGGCAARWVGLPVAASSCRISTDEGPEGGPSEVKPPSLTQRVESTKSIEVGAGVERAVRVERQRSVALR